jgi:hypothetical protein
MRCKSCGSANRSAFPAEMSIHFSGVDKLHRPPVFVSEKLIVCLDCGFTELWVSETEREQLTSPMLAGDVYQGYVAAE